MEGGLTPTGRPKNERRRIITRKRLFPSPMKQSVDQWSEEENKALVEYVLSTHLEDPTVWPSHEKGSKLVA